MATYYPDFTMRWSERKVSFGLTQEQLAQVGEITLQWGVADRMLGMARCRLLNQQTGGSSAKPVDEPFDRHVQALNGMISGSERTPFREELLRELGHAATHWRGERNNIAHGMPQDALEDEATILSVRGKRMKVSDLDRALERAVHVAVIAAQLEYSLLGMGLPPQSDDADLPPARARPRPEGLD